MTILRNSMLAAGATALLTISFTPAAAADVTGDLSPRGASDVLTSQANWHGGWGWGLGWGRRRHHDDGIDAGDVLTGIGILAGIAVLADAVSSNNKKRPRAEQRYPDNAPPPPPVNNGSASADDVGTAVSVCSAAAEQSAGSGARVQEIRSVTRDGMAWRVEGALSTTGFSCGATGGNIDYVKLGA